MAHGLFATLIVGTIIGTIGGLFAYGKGNGFCDFMFKLFSDSSEFSVSYCLKGYNWTRDWSWSCFIS